MTYQVPVTPGDRARAGLVQQLIAVSFGIPADDIRARGRLELKACRARWVALYLAHIGYGWPLERVGHVFGVTRATAGLGCRWAEDARDDPRLRQPAGPADRPGPRHLRNPETGA